MAAKKKDIDIYTVLASSVHDMKNSLSLLFKMIEDITDECIPDDHPSYDQVQKMKYEASRINNDLIQFLALYRMGNSRYFVNVEYHPLYDYIDELIIQNRPLLEYKGIEVQMDCADELCWFFDRELISGALNNVLNNLFKYSRNKVRISARQEEGYLLISVEDNGEGYPEALLGSGDGEAERVIDFTTGKTGLGLYFAQIAAEAHVDKKRCGFISIANGGAYGGGCFTIHLP